MLARRRDGRIREAGNDDVDVRMMRKFAVLRLIVGALHVFDGGRNGNRAAKMDAGARQACEIGERVESEIYFSGRAAIFVTAHFLDEFVGEAARVHHFQKCEIRINA